MPALKRRINKSAIPLILNGTIPAGMVPFFTSLSFVDASPCERSQGSDRYGLMRNPMKRTLGIIREPVVFVSLGHLRRREAGPFIIGQGAQGNSRYLSENINIIVFND